jgi:hypothetical protein
MDICQISRDISSDINTASVEIFKEPPRNHLGGSMIGEPCERKLWLSFRWTFDKTLEGRTYRLFNRGHCEEPRFERWLKQAGFQIWSLDQNGQQFKISHANGHLGGSLDGIAILPKKYNYKEPILLEYKTNGTGPRFKELLDYKVEVAKPMHYSQMCFYAADPKYNFKYALYLNVNKNDDQIHVEFLDLNLKKGEMLREKGARIINMMKAPFPSYRDKTNFNCKFCDAAKVCWGDEPAMKNCRSCEFSKPIENSNWFCSFYNSVIPIEFIPKGCEKYKCVL